MLRGGGGPAGGRHRAGTRRTRWDCSRGCRACWAGARPDRAGQQQQQRREYEDFVGRYDQGAPWDGISDQEAAQRYQQVAPRLSPQEYEESAQEAFARLSPQERLELGRYLQQQSRQRGATVPDLNRDGIDDRLQDPAYLAHAAGQMQQQQPGLLGQILGGGAGGRRRGRCRGRGRGAGQPAGQGGPRRHRRRGREAHDGRPLGRAAARPRAGRPRGADATERAFGCVRWRRPRARRAPPAGPARAPGSARAGSPGGPDV